MWLLCDEVFWTAGVGDDTLILTWGLKRKRVQIHSRVRTNLGGWEHLHIRTKCWRKQARSCYPYRNSSTIKSRGRGEEPW